MAKLPKAPSEVDPYEAPTRERTVPAELRDAHDADVHGPGYITTKLRKAEIEALLTKERQHRGSGMRRAVSDEDIDRFERRETRETLPAPPEMSAEGEEAPSSLAARADKPPPLPEDIADLDADDER